MLRIECALKNRNYYTCEGYIESRIEPKLQRPEVDPDWVEFVNATNERYKDANTDV